MQTAFGNDLTTEKLKPISIKVLSKETQVSALVYLIFMNLD